MAAVPFRTGAGAGAGAGAGDAAGRDDDDGRDPLADLRSVLRWCFRAVDPTAATDGDAVFSTFSEIDEANSAVAPAPEDLGPAGLDPRALGLFHCLFDRWIQLRDSTPPSSSPQTAPTRVVWPIFHKTFGDTTR